jgi:5-methylcytosine-specific restriction endonuclease McrA
MVILYIQEESVMGRESVIVLNFDYSYLNTVHWRKAFKYLENKKAEIVKAASEVVRTVDKIYTRPIIVRLLEMKRSVYRKKVPFSFKNVMKRDKYACQYCGGPAVEIDHVYPKSKGGKNTFENCVAACHICNNSKGDKLLHESGLKLKKQPYAPTIIQFIELRLEIRGVARTLIDYWDSLNG